jgi:hypothetical protein
MIKKSIFFNMPDKIFGISSGLIKLFLPPLLVVVLFLISIGLFVTPKIESIKKLKSSISSIKSKIETTEEKRSYLVSIDQEQLNRDANYLSSAVIQEKNSYILVGVIRNIADKYGYAVKSFSISPIKLKDESSEESIKVAQKDVAAKLPITVVLSGPTEKSLDLVKGLENNLPILFIDSYSTSSEKSNITELELGISSYYIADKTDLISGDLTLNDLKPTEEEVALLDTISKFDKSASVTKISDENGTFIEYKRDNPFNP